MRTFRFALRVAGLLTMVILVLFFSIALMFRHTVGGPFHEHLREIRATEVALFAFQLEARLGDTALDDAEAESIVAEFARLHGRDMAVLDQSANVLVTTSEQLAEWDTSSAVEVPCGERTCQVLFPGTHLAAATAPLLHDDRVVGALLVDQTLRPSDVTRRFLLGLASICALVLAISAVLSLYLTRPLRRMSRSMDRVAQGDLGHRVEVKGRDEVARMGESFNKMTDRVAEMIRGHKELLAGASHELRSPLARMKISLDLLANGADPERHIASLDDDVDSLDALVEELLTASRLDLGTETLRPESIELGELFDFGWRRVEANDEAGGVDLERDIDPSTLRVRADRSLAVRVLGNLFENAVRHAPGAPVEVHARAVDDKVVISVIDGGPGVPQEELGRLFDPFYRSDPSRSRRTGGTGLGLMIVLRAVEAMGGRVSAERAADEGGLKVTFDLPLGE